MKINVFKTSSHSLNNAFTMLLVFLLFLAPDVIAKVTAKVDRQFAYEGETVTLSVRAENAPNATAPDFSPLAKDFEVGGTSQSSSISIINGRSTSSRTWSVRLHPKKAGVIEIPALTAGQETTLPFKIEIKPIPVQTGVRQGQSIFVILEIDSKAKQFYVQQPIPLVAKLYYKHTINQGQISDPVPDNALVERLGDDKSYNAKYNDKDYKVFERRYSLLAEKSGELQIPSVTFQGKISQAQSPQTSQRRQDPFSQFFSNTPLLTQGQPVKVRSEPLSITIKSHPTSFSGQQWLPAESLLLKDSWTANPPNFKVGEPVSRTITIEATGLVASQIKPLELPAISSFRRYAEPAESVTRTDGQKVYATSSRTFTYIPAYPGEQEIPALQVDWWNVLTDEQQTATLPPWKIKVQEGTAPVPPVAPAAPSTVTPSSQAGEPGSRPLADPDSLLQQFKALFAKYGYWIVGFIILVYAMLVLLANRKKQTVEPAETIEETLTTEQATSTNTVNRVSNISIKPATENHTASKSQLLKDFQQACKANDARQVARTLIELAQLSWPEDPPRSIGTLAERVDKGKNQLLELDRYLYARTDSQWDGQAVCESFKNGFSIKVSAADSETILKPLYPK